MKKSKSRAVRAGGAVLIAVAAVAMLSASLSPTYAETKSTGFTTDFDSYEDTLRAGEDLNVELEGEGAVLLKNDNSALPLQSYEKNITLFGSVSTNLITGGSGSGSGTITSKMNSYDLFDGFEQAGFNTNPAVRGYYENQSYSDLSTSPTSGDIGPSGLSRYEDSYNLYGDAAVIVLGRSGGEMSDRARTGIHGNADQHYLELSQPEKDLIKYVEGFFDKVVILINSSNAMELGDIQYDDKIDSILWIGGTGSTGTLAIGKIFNGEVTPSGRLVDVYMADMKKDPTWFNSGDMSIFYDGENPNNLYMGAAMYGSNGLWDPSSESYGAYYALEYKEGIYMGYRWYETADAEGFFDSASETDKGVVAHNGDKYYNTDTGVVYPFGYGLSYTNFEYSNYSVIMPEDKDGDVKVLVTVKNVGNTSGKEVVQVYSHSPYINGGIEKADVDLVDYAKTKLLAPGESQKVEITFPLSDIAQFDYNDANGNDYSTYEIDAATNYTISLRSDSHNVITTSDNGAATYSFDIGNTIVYTKDKASGHEIVNMFSKGDINDSLCGKDAADMGFVTRKDGAFQLPTSASVEDRTFDDSYFQYMDDTFYYNSYEDKTTDKWYRSSVPASWTQATEVTQLNAADLTGVSYTEPVYDAATGTWTEATDEGTKKWEAFLNKMTYEQLLEVISNGTNGVVAMDDLNLAVTNFNDGPGQLKGGGNSSSTGDYGTYYVSEVVIASTWNVDLAKKQGQIIGNESLFLGTTGWWGPGANVHRTPFGGRNFEYYSQDGVQGGKICAAVMEGVRTKGVTVFVKHVGTNEQECLRAEPNSCTIATEQSIRQIYMKVFEYAYKAGCNAGMTCTTRIGVVAACNNYAMLNELMRDEWGADAMFQEDVEGQTWHDMNLNLRAGNSMPLNDRTGAIDGTWDAANNTVTVDASETDNTQVASPTQYYAVRINAQRVLEAVVNSNSMKNSVDFSSFADGSLATANVGLSYTANIGGQLAGVDKVVYTITDGQLPDGLTLATDGTVSGTATTAGSYTFTVKLVCDNWISKTATYTMNVEESVNMTGDATALKVGTDSELQVTSPFNEADYDAVTYTAEGNLPAGMQMNEKGLIYGEPTEAGSYTFKVTVTATKTTNNGSSNVVTTDVVSRTFTLDVAAAEQQEDPTPVTPDPTTETPVSETPTTETPTTEAPTSESGETTTKSGCGGSIVATTSLVAALGLAATAVVLKKKKED